MGDCAFCDIVAGAGDAHRLYDDDRTTAFLDDQPAARGHVLVVPRAHHEHLFGGEPELTAAVFRTVHRLALALYRGLEADGVSLFYTSSDLVGTVSHAHVHLVPRYVDDDIHLALTRGRLDGATADRLTARIREAL